MTQAQTIDQPIETFKQQITQNPTITRPQPAPGDVRPPVPQPSLSPTVPQPLPSDNILKTPENEKENLLFLQAAQPILNHRLHKHLVILSLLKSLTLKAALFLAKST